MYCKYCGSLTSNDSIFCKNCGATLTSEVLEARPSVFSQKSYIFIIFLLIATFSFWGCIKFLNSFGYFDGNPWGKSIAYFESKYQNGYEYDKTPGDSETTFSVPISEYAGVKFRDETTVAYCFYDDELYYVQLLFHTTDNAFDSAEKISTYLTKRYGKPSSSRPQNGIYKWTTLKSNIEVAVIGDNAIAVWFGDITSSHNKLSS